MNYRKFLLIVSSVMAVFLFITGIFLLTKMDMPKGSLLDGFVSAIKSENGPINILVLGGDQVASNTDTMILVNYNPSTAAISMLSIPRDTKISVPGSSVPKINSAYPVGGSQLAVETVSKLLNVKIKYYVFINTAAFRQIIDTLGGVDFNVPVDMNYDDPTQNLHIHLKKGMQHMDGASAEKFMRFRQPTSYNNEILKYYDGGDIKRISAQQNFIKELIRQKATLKYISKLDNIISIVFKNIDTNISLNDTVKLAQNLGKTSSDELKTFTLPGSPEEGGLWYYIMDKVKTQEIIKQYFSSNAGLSAPKASDNNKPQTEKSTPRPTPKPSVKPTPEPTSTVSPAHNNPSNPGNGVIENGVGSGP